MRARWASSARCRWFRVTSAVQPTRCRCTSEILYNEYQFAAAFAAASLLALLALVTLALKLAVERRYRVREPREGAPV